MNTDEHRLNDITHQCIAAAFAVSNELGCGFLEKVYENAMAVELRRRGLCVEQQKSVTVFYQGEPVGDYIADIVVNSCVILELKAVREFDPVHAAQCVNYLRATGLPICLLINFGSPRVKIKRFIRPDLRASISR